MAEQQLRVFVSHSYQDDDFCREIVTALRDAGSDVWYDEHNMGPGSLMDVIMRELGSRPIFVLILSKAAIASRWVKREAGWAYELYDREPERVILPVTAEQLERNDFSPNNGWLFLHDFKRVEQAGYKPYTANEAAKRLLHALALTPIGEVPISVAPHPQEDVDDLLTRGRALNAKGERDRALPLFERAIQLDPSSFDAWMAYGFTLRNSRRNQDAKSAYERAITLNPDRASAWTGKGLALFYLHRASEALIACEHATQIEGGTYPYAWNGMGIALISLGRFAEALNALNRAINLYPQNALFWGNKATALRGLGQTDEAEAAEQRARELAGRRAAL